MLSPSSLAELNINMEEVDGGGANKALAAERIATRISQILIGRWISCISNFSHFVQGISTYEALKLGSRSLG